MARIKLGNVRTPIEYLKQFFAPAGYGLGSFGVGTTDLDTNTKGGIYSFTEGCKNSPFSYGVVLVLNRYDVDVVQIVFNVSMKDGYEGGSIARRIQVEGEWHEWEYFNPPMHPGVEYRTTERWQGRPVYYKVVDFGGLPNATTATVPIGAENIGWAFLDLSKSWAGPASDLATNYLPNCANITEIVIRDGKISITTNISMTGTLAYIAVKYTKN